MPAPEAVIDRAGHPVAESWIWLAEDVPVPETGRVIVPLARLGETERGGLGVVLEPADRIEALVPHLDRVDLVVLRFPKFRDGRGFSQARALRERHFYAGEIRAAGHVLPDQFEALLRCGVSSVALGPGQDPATWQAALALRDGAGAPLLRRLAVPIAVG